MKIFFKAALAAASFLTTPALADMQNIYQSGEWTVFSGVADDGTPGCGMEEIGPDKMFAIKWFNGSDHLLVHLFKQSWHVPAGTKVPVQVQFDQAGPWQAVAEAGPTPYGSILAFDVPDDDNLQTFLDEVRYSVVMRISFPGSRETDWLGDMTGSNKAMDVFGTCMSYVQKRFPATPQAAAPTPAAPSADDAKFF